MSEIYPSSSSFSHLMEQIISEQFQQVPVSCFRPFRVHIQSVNKTGLHRKLNEWNEIKKKEQVKYIS